MSPSKEVDAVVSEAPDYDALAREAEALRAVVAVPSAKEVAVAKLARIEQQLAARREVEGTTAARERLIGIKRAYGSLLNEYGQDRGAVKAAVRALADAIEALNARAGQLRHLREEVEGLTDRFDLDAPKLAAPREPESELDMTLPRFWQHPLTPVGFEDDAFKLRQRRTYGEIADTDGYEIIVAAGLKPWPDLTDAQKATVAERKEDLRQQQESAARFAAEAEIARALPFAGGDVKRG